MNHQKHQRATSPASRFLFLTLSPTSVGFCVLHRDVGRGAVSGLGMPRLSARRQVEARPQNSRIHKWVSLSPEKNLRF